MHSIETLNIKGYGGQEVPNTFFHSNGETDHLVVLLPGFGYTSHMPVLYYPGIFLLSQGADVMRAEYNYARRPEFMELQIDERRKWAAEDATALFTDAFKQREYSMVTLIGKSIGTVAMGHLITSVKDIPKLRCLWLTPVLKSEQLIAQIKKVGHRAMFVIGTEDQYYNKDVLLDLVTITGGESVVIKGADHSLEVGSDVLKSLQALETIMSAVKIFLG
jgi:hypothetical protein